MLKVVGIAAVVTVDETSALALSRSEAVGFEGLWGRRESCYGNTGSCPLDEP